MAWTPPEEIWHLVGGKPYLKPLPLQVFMKLLRDYTTRKSPKERIKSRKARKTKASHSTSKTRYIPAATKDEVHVRDQGQCTYVSPTGTRCSCKQNLEYDHIMPFSLGGESSAENLRLFCKAHNQLMAERAFGREFMEEKRLN